MFQTFKSLIFEKKSLKNNYWSLLLLLLCFNIWGQENYTISGTITSAASNETLIGVNVIIPELNKGAVTNEYGFYSNVNPQVDHPRWSQKRERLITGEGGFAALFSKKIDTLMFNGYAEEVADLYKGLDLYKHF